MAAADKVTLGKGDFVELIAASSDISKKDAAHALQLVIDGVEKALAAGKDVNILGFGKFKVDHVPERQGRNPGKNEVITISARNRVSFAAGATLKAAVNQ